MEPRLGRVCVLLGGAGLVDAYYDHPQAAPYRKLWEAIGGTKEQVKRLLAPIDPITCAANLKDRKVLLIAGKLDDIMPPKATESALESRRRAEARLVQLLTLWSRPVHRADHGIGGEAFSGGREIAILSLSCIFAV